MLHICGTCNTYTQHFLTHMHMNYLYHMLYTLTLNRLKYIIKLQQQVLHIHNTLLFNLVIHMYPSVPCAYHIIV